MTLEIKLVQQPTADSCTSACLSMLTGIPVNEVISDFHHRWKDPNDGYDPSSYLMEKGCPFIVSRDPFNNFLVWGRVYLLTVPSLNVEGGLHHIVVDVRGEEEKVFDPNEGKEGRRYYYGWSGATIKSPLAVKLHGWIVDLWLAEGAV